MEVELYRNIVTSGQYQFIFILFCLLLVLAYNYCYKEKNSFVVWGLTLLFSLFSFYDSDYFSYEYMFHQGFGGKDFRDPLYYYISLVCFDNYILFRFIVWGSALLLYKKTIDHLVLNPNVAIFTFAVFWIMIFAYARASLGMALYFYGLSFLINRDFRTFRDIIFGTVFIIFSYFGHRSMLPIIAMTPLAFINLDKKKIFLLLLSYPLLIYIFSRVFLAFSSDAVDLDDSLSGFQAAATAYASAGEATSYVGLYALMTNFRVAGFYLLMIYFVWTVVIKEYYWITNTWYRGYLNIAIGILVLAGLFLLSDFGIGNATLLGYRYMFISAIPLCLCFSYHIQNGDFSIKLRNLLLILPAGSAFILMLRGIISH